MLKDDGNLCIISHDLNFMQMGNFLTGHPRLGLTVGSSDNQEIKDQTVADNDGIRILDDEKRTVDECASDKELGKQCQPGIAKVPKRPRTPRVFIGQLTYKSGGGAYEFRSAQMIIDEKNSRKSEKRPLDEGIVPDGAFVRQLTCEPAEATCQYDSAQVIIDEKNSKESEKRPLDEDIVPDGALVRQLTCEPAEDTSQYDSTQMIIDEKNSRRSKKRPLDDDYVVSTDGNGVESSAKRQNNGGKKIMAVRGRQTSQVQNYPPSELPQNLQDYISKLNLESPLLFVAQKVLFASDIRRDQNRLLLPKTIINPAFFENYVTDKDMKMLMEGNGVGVSMVDNKMHEYHTLNFAKWNMKSTSNYVLKTGWFDVVKDNKLEEAVLQKDDKSKEAASSKNAVVVVVKEDDKLKSDVVVQVWCSQKEGRLWFALNIQAMTECNFVGKTKEGRSIVKKLRSD
ncbi:uncharacterized protein LOC141698522 [Apium graveolens]|uniref:uncharacterized protein LOC141698522 n=1 Tax=Apium graveolens TaxID=4045 RepID=UPI003D7A571B